MGAWVELQGVFNCTAMPFTEAEITESSSWRELKAVDFALKSFIPLLAKRSILWLTDNSSIVSIINKGSPKLRLHQLANEIFSTCREADVSMQIQWIPRTYNEIADYLSRVADWDDWSVRDEIFSDLDVMYGPHSCDLFANACNAKSPKFYSRFWQPGCAAVNAFSQNWSTDFNWMVPPICLIGRALKHLCNCGARATLVCPEWPSAMFWPILFPHGAAAWFVKSVFTFHRFSAVFSPGTQISSVFAKPRFPSRVLVIQLDASNP